MMELEEVPDFSQSLENIHVAFQPNAVPRHFISPGTSTNPLRGAEKCVWRCRRGFNDKTRVSRDKKSKGIVSSAWQKWERKFQEPKKLRPWQTALGYLALGWGASSNLQSLARS